MYFLARLVHEHCERVGTRRGTRVLGPFRHAVMALRRFLDAARVRQLAAAHDIGKSTCCDRLREAIDLLAALAPDVHEAILAANAAGAARPTSLAPSSTDRVAMKGPNGADPWRSGKHKCHGGNIQALSDPSGFLIRVSGLRPGREHDTACAKAAPGLLDAPAACESEDQIPTLTDLGYLNVSPAIRHPHKKPKGGELTERRRPRTTRPSAAYTAWLNARTHCSKRPSRPCRRSASARHASARSPRPPHSSYSTSNITAPCQAATRNNIPLPGKAQYHIQYAAVGNRCARLPVRFCALPLAPALSIEFVAWAASPRNP